MPTVQFKGKDEVIAAYKSRDVDVWSLFDHKRLMIKGTGSDELEEFLDLIGKGGTNGVYTLKIYEELTDPKQVKSNTADDGSFNFKLNTESQEITGAQYSSLANRNEILQRLDELEAKIEGTSDEETKPVTLGSVVTHVLSTIKSPADVVTLIELGKSLLGFPSNVNAAMQSIPAIGNINQPVPGTPPASQEEQLMRIGAAIEQLSIEDPKICEHLEKLAKISKDSRETFKFFITTLEAMP